MSLEPLGYHKAMRDHLKKAHPEIWEWFASGEAQSDYAASVELELLKSTYRMDRDHHQDLYAVADEASSRLELDVPITLYQSQDTSFSSAALYYTPGQGHVVLIGNTLSLLSEDELRAAIGHELAHFKLWTVDDGEFLVADRLLVTLSNEPRAEPCHIESARLYQLYTEIYADHGSYIVSEDAETVVSTLVKIYTGLDSVDPTSYLAQAEEIYEKNASITTEGNTHPEAFIRARTIRLWSEPQGLEGEGDSGAALDHIEKMIQGPLQLEKLDLLGQQTLSTLTGDLIRLVLAPAWMRTEKNVAHARLFSSDLDVTEAFDHVALMNQLKALQPYPADLENYFAYILLDFSSVDRDLEQNALASAFVVAEELDLADRLQEVAGKELKLLKRDTTRLRKDALALVLASGAEAARSIEEGGSDDG